MAQNLVMDILIAANATAAIKQFIELNKEIDNLKRGLTATLGSETASDEALSRLRQQADLTGQSFLNLAKQYASFAAAARGTALEGEATTQIFNVVSGAMGTLGRSTEETQRAFVALSQMMSKGQVYAEEWKGQLSEALPAANAAVQKATGLTTQEFMRLMESGNLLATEAIPALVLGLEQLGLTATEKVDTLSASLNRLENSVTTAFTRVGEEGLTDAFKGAIDGLSGAVTGLGAGTVALGKNMGALAAYVTGAIPDWEALTEAFAENNAEGQKVVDGQAGVAAATSETAKRLGEMGAASLKAASDHAKLAESAKEAFELVKDQGKAATEAAKANIELARIAGDTAKELRAEAEAARVGEDVLRARAGAAQKMADETTRFIGVLTAEAAELEKAKGANAEQAAQLEALVKAKQQQIEKQQALLATQQATVKETQALAEQERLAAEQAQLAADTYGDQSAKLEALREEHERAAASVQVFARMEESTARAGKELAEVQAEIEKLLKSRIATSAAGQARLKALEEAERTLKEELEAGKGITEDLARAREEEAIALARVKDALADTIQAAEREVRAKERQTDAMEEENDLRVTQLRNLAREAEARGETAEAARLEEEANAELVRSKEALAAAYTRELAALEALAEAKRQEADADGTRTAEEAEAIAQAEADVAAKQQQIAEIQELIRHLELLNEVQGEQNEKQGEQNELDEEGNEIQKEKVLEITQTAAAVGMLKEAMDFVIGSLREWNSEAADAVEAFQDAGQSWAETTENINNLADGIANGAGSFSGAAGQIRRDISTLSSELESSRQNIERWTNSWSASQTWDLRPFYNQLAAIERVKAATIAAELADAKMELRKEELAEAMDKLSREYESGALSLAEYQQRLQGLEATYQSLGEENLSGLRDALKDAKDLTDDLRESAQSALEAALSAAEAAGLGSTEIEREQIRYKQTMADLEEQLAEARKAGDAQAIADLQRAIDLQKKAHEAKMAQLRDELAAEEAITEERARRDTNPAQAGGGGAGVPDNGLSPTPSTGGSGDIPGNITGLAGAMAGAMNTAVQAQTKTWEDTTNRIIGALDGAIQAQTQALAGLGNAAGKRVALDIKTATGGLATVYTDDEEAAGAFLGALQSAGLRAINPGGVSAALRR